MVSFQVSGQPALRFKVAARSVLFAGSRRGQVEQPVCRALVERFPPPRVRVLRGLRDRRRCGVPRGAGPLSVRPRRGVRRLRVRASAHGAAGPRGCSPRRWCPRASRPNAALARRTLWLVKRSSLVVLFPERPADRQWGSGLAACLSLGALPPQADLRGGLTAACRSGVLSGGDRRPVRHGRRLLGGAAHLPRRPLRRRVLRVQIGASASR